MNTLIKAPKELDILPISSTQHLRVVIEAKSFWIDTQELYFPAGTYTKKTIEDAVNQVSKDCELRYQITRVWRLEDGIKWEDVTLNFDSAKQIAYIYLVHPDRPPWQNQDTLHIFFLDWVTILNQSPKELRELIQKQFGETVFVRSIRYENVTLGEQNY